MPRRHRLIAAVAALLTLAPALPGMAPGVAAASCSGWSSSTTPPPTIRVFRHASGNVETVDFRNYAKNVLSREWIASWTTESLRSGALAVKHYAWYQVLHWRGGTNASGACFDVRDDTWDQVYDPSRPTYTTAAAAVDATWGTRVLKNGAIFPTYYNAGAAGEACGANKNGWKMYQWGTQACGLAGKTAAQIIATYYYPNVTVTDAPAPTATPQPTATPRPTPTPTPQPTATPKPSASSPPTATASATPTASPAPTRTPRPTPKPTPQPTVVPTPIPQPSAPLATPPPDQLLPGGGQSGLQDDAQPPAPPPDDPHPVVNQAGRPPRTSRETTIAPQDPMALHFRAWLLGTDGGPLLSRFRLSAMQAGGLLEATEAPSFATLWRAAFNELRDSLLQSLAAARLAGGTGVAGGLGNPPGVAGLH
jgi:hypothetical protein